jgi:hypothetical protein
MNKHAENKNAAKTSETPIVKFQSVMNTIDPKK